MGVLLSPFMTAGPVVSGILYGVADAPRKPISFSDIPPERVGLQGEYDYNGLAKRIHRRCVDALGAAAVANLQFKQRGSVAVLHGCVSNRSILEQVVRLSVQTEGTTNVELCEVRLAEISPTSSPMGAQSGR